MRIVTTWMYFDPSQIETEGRRRYHRGRGEEAEPGVGIAWCAGDTTNLMPISNLKVFRDLPTSNGGFSEEILRSYIDSFLIDEEYYEFVRSEYRILNQSSVDYILKESFVIEQSPPINISIKGILTNTNLHVWIGTYMAWNEAPDHSVLLFIIIPGGILVLSSAMGLANALAFGLSTSVKQLFQQKLIGKVETP